MYMDRITDLNEKKLTFSKLALYYSVLFVIFALGIFSVFIIFGKSFIQTGDGFKQGYFWTAEIKHLLSSVLSGNGIPQWNWSRGLGMQYLYRLDPFNLFASLFPLKYLEIGITISLVLKLYFGGLAYLLFAWEQKMSNYQCVLGSLLYIFSTWFINITMTQSSFIFISFMIPLLMLGIDRIYRGRSPVLFIVAVAYFLIRDTYLAYMAAIVAVIFMLLRYFAYNDRFDIKNYFVNLGRFIFYGLLGAMISAAFFMQFVLATFRASTESPYSGALELLANPSFFTDLGKMLTTYGLTKGYTFIGLPILALLLLPLALKKISLKNTSVLMTVILLVMMFFPFFGRMFNGFSYSTGRWYVMIVFFASWATMEVLDLKVLQNRKNLIIMAVWLAVIAAGTLGFDAVGLTGLSLRGKAFIILDLMAGAALIFVISAFRKKPFTILHRQIATICISGLVLIVAWSMSFYLYQDKFINNGDVADRLSNSNQRVSGKLADDGFYRTDQVDWINVHKDLQMPANENLWWQANSIYVYDSFTSSKQLDFNKYVGNNYGYIMRVYILSNDNRMGLDFLQGVKYFLGSDTKTSPADVDIKDNYLGKTLNADNYHGYGFSYAGKVDGVSIFKNKYDSGLGFAYDKYISESEYLKLSRAEREQALLQAVVIPDDECASIKGVEKIKAKDVDTDVSDIGYKIADTDGITIKDGKLTASKDNSSITLKLDNVKDSQLLVSFDNLVSLDGSTFSLYCNDNKFQKVIRTCHSNQCIPGVVDFDINMGYYKNYDGTIKLTISHAGEYTFDRFYISAMKVSNYDKYAKERIAMKYNISKYDSSHVSGTVSAARDSILYLSIPQYTNWDVYVDGVKTDKIENANIAYLGVMVPKGEHSVVLKYSNSTLKYGIVASVIGLIITIIIGIYFRKKRTVLSMCISPKQRSSSRCRP